MAFKYFSKLPVIEYSLDKATTKKARDILHRVFFDQKFIDDSDYFVSYSVSDGDRPEVISNKLYGRTDIYSVIMLINEFDVSMLNGLPPTSAIYQEYIETKYSDPVYYLKPIIPAVGLSNGSGASGGLSGGYVHPIFGYGFEVGERIFGTDRQSFQNYEVRAYVKEWNPVMCSLKLDIINGSFGAGSTISSADGTIRFIVSKVLSGEDAVHHFEVPNTLEKTNNTWSIPKQIVVKGSIVDPLSSYETSGGTVGRISPIGVNKNGFTGDYFRSVIYRHNTNTFSPISDYVRIVTNREYEESILQKKRVIRIPTTNNSLRGVLVNKISELLESSNQ